MSDREITLLAEAARISIEDITARFGRESMVLVCDFYLEQIESRGQLQPYGFHCGNIINIDHHAPVPEMERPISSAPLAALYVHQCGVQPEAIVAVNHTDCDSVLSSAIARGILPPDARLCEAAIAADHTGEANPIADLLQALNSRRNLDLSLRNLRLLLSGQPLEPEAQVLVDKRHQERARARDMVAGGAFRMLGGVAFAQAPEKIDGAFLPALLPDSAVILFGCPLGDEGVNQVPGLSQVKVRLGMSAPKGITLHSLGLRDTPLGFNGRWNAGSNKRAGGTRLPIEECAAIVLQKLQQAIAKST